MVYNTIYIMGYLYQVFEYRHTGYKYMGCTILSLFNIFYMGAYNFCLSPLCNGEISKSIFRNTMDLGFSSPYQFFSYLVCGEVFKLARQGRYSEFIKLKLTIFSVWAGLDLWPKLKYDFYLSI